MGIASSTELSFKFFATKERFPEYTTDPGCREIGKLTVKVPGSGIGRSVQIRMVFSDTELHAEAIDQRTLVQTRATLNFLG